MLRATYIKYVYFFDIQKKKSLGGGCTYTRKEKLFSSPNEFLTHNFFFLFQILAAITAVSINNSTNISVNMTSQLFLHIVGLLFASYVSCNLLMVSAGGLSFWKNFLLIALCYKCLLIAVKATRLEQVFRVSTMTHI